MKPTRRLFLGGLASSALMLSAAPSAVMAHAKLWDVNALVDEINRRVDEMEEYGMDYSRDEIMAVKARGGWESDPAVIEYRNAALAVNA